MSKTLNIEWKKIFDSIAHEYNKVINTYNLTRRTEFFISLANGDCLEIGAATGLITKKISEKHYIIATDISPNMVHEIQKNQEIEAYCCDAEHLPFSNCSFDTIIASECIYYLNNPDNFFKEAFRILRPNGRLLLSSMNKIVIFYNFVLMFLRFIGFKKHVYFKDDKNRYYFSKNSLYKLLLSNYFKITSYKKIIFIPFKIFHKLNKIIEKTILKHLCICTLICAGKDIE